MSLSDWDRYAGNVSDPSVDFEIFATQNWGAPILHSSLADPLSGVGEGVYLRRFGLSGVSGAFQAGTIFASLSAGVGGGVFVSPDETHAQEARAWMRAGSDLGGGPTSGVAIGGRWRHTATAWGFTSRWGASGYYATFGRARPGTSTGTDLKARLVACGGNGASAPSTKMVEVDDDPATGAPWLQDTWYRFRWRLVPTGLVGDEMTMHRLVDGGDESDEGDWLAVASLSVSAALDPTVYQAPGAGSRYGFAATAAGNGPVTSFQPYIDLVEFYSATV